ncbi:MAG: ATP-binding protein [Myxococcota bacterium]
MERFFNTAGPPNAAEHYVLDPLSRWNLPRVLALIDQRKYFLLHAPRQTGKTTCLLALCDYLNQQGRFRCVYINVEEAQAAEENVEQGMRAVLYRLGTAAQEQTEDAFVDQNWERVLARAGPLQALGATLSSWCRHSAKPIVLLIDEADALMGKTLISLLRQLRAGYLIRAKVPFPQSVILCGLRDIRDYRVNPEDRVELQRLASAGSPFNIKSDSLRLGDFSQDDVKNLYAQHTQETGQKFGDGVRERVFELTQGQPWLVNALAYDACFRDEAGRDRSRSITLDDIDEAKERLIKRRETHLDQLTDKLKQERVHRVLESMMGRYDSHPTEEDFDYVTDIGLIRQDETKSSVIANPIYREIIPRVLTASWERDLSGKTPSLAKHGQPLDMNELLSAFQRFFREHSESWLDQFQYKEAGPQLLLQAFLQRTVNSHGSIQREQAVGSGRTDLIVSWPLGDKDVTLQRAEKKQIIVLELKLIHRNDGADSVMTKGLKQTARYMDRFHAPEGHLILFDRRKGKSWDERIWTKQQIAPDGKNITVWAM